MSELNKDAQNVVNIGGSLARRYVAKAETMLHNVNSPAKAEEITRQLMQTYYATAAQALLNDGKHVGNRVNFADGSFFDIYLNAPDVIFFNDAPDIQG